MQDFNIYEKLQKLRQLGVREGQGVELAQSSKFLKKELLEDNSVQVSNLEVTRFAAETTRETNFYLQIHGV